MNEVKIEKRLKRYVKGMLACKTKEGMTKIALRYLKFVYKQKINDMENFISEGKSSNTIAKFKHYNILVEVACEKGTSFTEIKREFVKTYTLKRYQALLEVYLDVKGERNDKSILHSVVHN